MCHDLRVKRQIGLIPRNVPGRRVDIWCIFANSEQKRPLLARLFAKMHQTLDYLRHDYRRWDVLLALLRGDYWHRPAKLWDLPDAYPYRYPERFRIHAWRMSEKCGLDTIGAQFGLSSKTFGIL